VPTLTLRFLGAALFAGVAICGCAAHSVTDQEALPPLGLRSAGSSPIKHVIVVIQENRSFDDLFATFPNADGTTTGQAEPMPKSIASYCSGQGMPVITRSNTTVPLTQVSLTGNGFPGDFAAGADLPHTYEPGFLLDYDAGAMDGFDLEGRGPNGSGQWACTYPYQYVNPKQIAEYVDLATQYVLADQTFQTQGSGSFTAHQDLIAGATAVNYKTKKYGKNSVIDNPTGSQVWGCDSPPGAVTTLITTQLKLLSNDGPFPCFTYKTMRDLLDAKSVSWKYYAQAVGQPAGIWSAFDAISAVRHGAEWRKKVVSPDTLIFDDIKNGKLPAVVWISPDAQNSDHPNEVFHKKLVDDGPSWVASIVNAVGTSKYWKSSAIVILWDDWGGFYDHESPAFLRDDQGGLGFRVPMLIVSPYVAPHVEHTQYEFGSILKFIEERWNLGSLHATDERATSIGNVFDYNQRPRRFKKIPARLPLSFFLHQRPSGVVPDSE
jgi:phospholipase C